MLNYRDWVEQAKRFLESFRHLPGEVHLELEVTPPASQVAIDACQRSLSIPIPQPVQRFLLTASTKFDLFFSWDPDWQLQRQIKEAENFLASYKIGDPVPERVQQPGPVIEQRRLMDELFGPSSRIFGELRINLGDFVGHQVACKDWCREASSRSVRDGWLRAFPFAWLGNGDYIALDMRTPRKPQVLWLTHDDLEKLHILASSFDEFLLQMDELCFIQIWFWMGFRDSATLQVLDSERLTKLHRLFGLAESK